MKKACDELLIEGTMRSFSMVNEKVRPIIVKHVAELANGQECTLKLTYKEVDKRGDDGKYAGHDLYFVDDVSVPDWVYDDLKEIFMEE